MTTAYTGTSIIAAWILNPKSHCHGTYRAVYTVKFEEAVFVLHAFQKKSKRGIETPKEDMEIIRSRLKIAAIMAEGLKNAKDDH